MASCSKSENWGNLGCSADATADFTYETTLTDFAHDPNDASQAIISTTATAKAVLKNVKWDDTSDNVGLAIYSMTNVQPWELGILGTFPKSLSDNCADLTNSPMTVSDGMTSVINAESASIMYSGRWGVDGQEDDSAHDPSQLICPFFFETLPNEYMITPPQNLSASAEQVYQPDILDEGSFTVPVSLTSWSKNPNIGGTPTTLPNARAWNIAVDVIDGLTYEWIDRVELNIGEELSVDVEIPTAKLKANAEYRLRIYASNEYNAVTSVTSPVFYIAPPKPSVEVVNWAYNSANSTTLQFRWSKPLDGGKYNEEVRYSIFNEDGVYYKTAVLLGSTSNGAGIPAPSSATNFVSVSGLPTGHIYTIQVTVTTEVAPSQTRVVSRSPVQPATIGDITWDDVRRVFTITGTAPNVTRAAIRVGYAPALWGPDETANEQVVGTQEVQNGVAPSYTGQDLAHGNNQKLYAVVTPLDPDGNPYYQGQAMKNFEIPNPILGVKIPKCGSDDVVEFIVDIIERKADGTATAAWQSGDRLVEIQPCGGEIIPGDTIYNVTVTGAAKDFTISFEREDGIKGVTLAKGQVTLDGGGSGLFSYFDNINTNNSIRFTQGATADDREFIAEAVREDTTGVVFRVEWHGNDHLQVMTPSGTSSTLWKIVLDTNLPTS